MQLVPINARHVLYALHTPSPLHILHTATPSPLHTLHTPSPIHTCTHTVHSHPLPSQEIKSMRLDRAAARRMEFTNILDRKFKSLIPEIKRLQAKKSNKLR